LYNPLGALISRGRSPSSREKYASIGGGSPQLKITKAQGRAIEAALGARGIRAKSYVAMRYWSPYAADVVQAIKADGIKRVVVLSLYPQFSMSTTGSSLRDLESQFKEDPSLKDIRDAVIPSFHKRDGYINALAGQITEKIDAFSKEQKPCILFSAHGLPTRFLNANKDPYQAQTEETVAAVMERLREMGYLNDHRLAYQSRVGPVKWLGPNTDDVIKQLASEGEHNLVVVPISFVSEHIETLEEIDMEYKEVADEAGITGWQRVPALGINTDFINDLAEAVIEVLPQGEQPSPLSLSGLNDGINGLRDERINS
jgi:ferrochelatase